MFIFIMLHNLHMLHILWYVTQWKYKIICNLNFKNDWNGGTETPASSIDLAMTMDQKCRVVGWSSIWDGEFVFVFIQKATAFSECQVQWPVEKERRGRCWEGKRIENYAWVVEIAWDPERVSLLTSRKLTLQHPCRQRRWVLKLG